MKPVYYLNLTKCNKDLKNIGKSGDLAGREGRQVQRWLDDRGYETARPPPDPQGAGYPDLYPGAHPRVTVFATVEC